MASPKTLTVIGPHGSEVTVLKPGLGQIIVIAQAGATVRGMRFDHPTLRRNCCDLGRVVNNYLFTPSLAVIC
jgi:hypothetical protein